MLAVKLLEEFNMNCPHLRVLLSWLPVLKSYNAGFNDVQTAISSVDQGLEFRCTGK